MVSIRSSSFVLGLVFIFLALKDTLAYTNQIMERMEAGDRIFTTEKENFDAVPTAVEARIGGFGGRKMMGERVLAKKMEMVKEEVANRGALMISGKDMNISEKPLAISQQHMHEQDDTGILNPKLLDSAATSVFVNLVNRDYQGGGNGDPNPPINNK